MLANKNNKYDLFEYANEIRLPPGFLQAMGEMIGDPTRATVYLFDDNSELVHLSHKIS